MKKNGEFVGVDEKYVPEDEKYVDESLLGNNKKAKETTKKVVMGVGIGYLVFAIIGLILFIVIGVFVFKTFNSTFDKSNSIINGTDKMNQSMMDKFENGANDLYDKFNEDRENHMNSNNQENNKVSNDIFNAKFEMYNGTNGKNRVCSLIDSVVLNNKKNKDKIISISYNGNEVNDLIKLKYDLDNDKNYEVNIDYNDNGLINKITIYDVK